MRKRICYTLSVLILLALAAMPFGAQLPPEYAGTPTASDYPLADLLVLDESHNWTLMDDGGVEYRKRTVEKLLTFHGLDEVGDPHVAFNSATQELKILKSRTFTQEGLTVDSKDNAFNEMTPFALEKAPDYADWRQMVITRVGLDVGAVIEGEYTITDTTPWRRFLDGVEVFQNGYPALRRSVSVTVPEGMDIQYKLFNGNAEPEVKTEGGATTYTWVLTDIPGLHMAGDDAEGLYLPTLVFTTAPNWAHQASTVGNKVAEAIDDVSPELQKKVDALLKGKPSEYDKAAALHKYINEAVNTIEWPVSDFDYAPRGAAVIFNSGYGHALDKAVLLSAMLKVAGITAPVAATKLALPGAVDPAAVPSLYQMDGFLLHTKVGDDVLWLDPTATLKAKSQRDFQGIKGLPLIPGMGELHIMDPVGGANASTVTLKVEVADDLSLKGGGTIDLSGNYSPYYALRGCSKAQKKAAQKIMKGLLPGIEVGDISVVRMDPANVTLYVMFEAKAPCSKKVPKTLTVGTPENSLLAGTHAHQSRALPLDLHTNGVEKVTVTFELPEDVRPNYVPKGITLSGTGASLTRTWTLEDGALTFNSEATIPNRIVQPADYPTFRELTGTAASKAATTLIFP